MTNSKYFSTNCTIVDHMAIINRMAQAVIRERCPNGIDSPLWEKEKVIDAWLQEEFDYEAFCKASINYSDGSRLNVSSSGTVKGKGHKIA